MRKTSTARPALFEGEPLEAAVQLLTAFLILMVGIMTFLLTDAGIRSTKASRFAQGDSLKVVGVRARGEISTGYAIGDSFRLWLELDRQASAAKAAGQNKAATQYLAARDQLTTLSPLLQAPYFNSGDGTWPKVATYEADTYIIEMSRLGEQVEASYAVSDGWSQKVNAYSLQILLASTVMFLYSQLNSFKGWLKWLGLMCGITATLAVLIWGIMVTFTPVAVRPQAAIDAFARGVGAAYQLDYDGAITAFDQAIELAPDYANAYYNRATAYYKKGKYDPAARDYAIAIAAGRSDTNAFWNLGWTDYILGQYDEAIANTRRAIENAPDQVALRFNLGLVYLASGRTDQAQMTYNSGMALASDIVTSAQDAGQQPPASLWYYLSVASADLDRFVNCISPDPICTEAPPPSAIQVTQALSDTAITLTRQLKGFAVALEYTGKPPEKATGVKVDNLKFATGLANSAGEVVSYTPLQTQASNLRFGLAENQQSEFQANSLIQASPSITGTVYALFDFTGVENSAVFIAKIYQNGQEIPGLRLVQAWNLGASGNAVLPITSAGFTLSPGVYQVEIYINSHLVQQSSFLVPKA